MTNNLPIKYKFSSMYGNNFIKLTYPVSKKPVYVNKAMIVQMTETYNEDTDKRLTSVSTLDNNVRQVTESIVEILKLIDE